MKPTALEDIHTVRLAAFVDFLNLGRRSGRVGESSITAKNTISRILERWTALPKRYADIVVDVCRDYDIAPELVLSPSRTKVVSSARAMVLYRIWEKYGTKSGSLSRAIGVDDSAARIAVSRVAVHLGKRPPYSVSAPNINGGKVLDAREARSLSMKDAAINTYIAMPRFKESFLNVPKA